MYTRLKLTRPLPGAGLTPSRQKGETIMSLAIDIDHVRAVLLAGSWYEVADASFGLDSYEYLWHSSPEARRRGDFQTVHGGGNSGVCATGFSFKTSDGDRLAGPLTAITAVRYDQPPDE